MVTSTSARGTYTLLPNSPPFYLAVIDVTRSLPLRYVINWSQSSTYFGSFNGEYIKCWVSARISIRDSHFDMAAYKRRYVDVMTNTCEVDRRALLFWLLQLAGALSFVFWLVVATAMSRISVALDFRPTRYDDALPSVDNSPGHMPTSVLAYNCGVFDAESF
ncbi:hypothetical protein RU639_005966 [Aspergillus parasiticus]